MVLQNTQRSGFRLSLQRTDIDASHQHFTHYLQRRRLVSGKKFVSDLHSNHLRYVFQAFYDSAADLFNQVHVFRLLSYNITSIALLPHFFQQLFFSLALYEHFHAEVGSTSPPRTTTISTTS
jgi:hypothetical protein